MPFLQTLNTSVLQVTARVRFVERQKVKAGNIPISGACQAGFSFTPKSAVPSLAGGGRLL